MVGEERKLALAAAFFLVLGVVQIAIGPPMIGWFSILFGSVGAVAYVGTKRGWLPLDRPPAPSRNAAADPLRTTPRPGAQRMDPPGAPVPQLSGIGRQQVDRIVEILGRAGVFAPQSPDPRVLYEAAVDHLRNVDVEEGDETDDPGPVGVDIVLEATGEADYYHPQFRLEHITANLVQHGTQVEQFGDYLREQIDDLVRLARGALQVTVHTIDQVWTDGSREVPTTIRWTVNGVDGELRYLGSTKYLSTELHVALARALRGTGSPRRLAWLGTTSGQWITTLPDGSLGGLNAELGLDGQHINEWDRWRWVDEDEPYAAGDEVPP